MKIIVTSRGPNGDSTVDPQFGRAKYFVLVDTQSNVYSGHDNTPNVNAMQGAGIQAAQTVARLGAEVVLTGHVGPKAFVALQAANVAVYTVTYGTVRQAVEQFTAGRLRQADEANVKGHWA